MQSSGIQRAQVGDLEIAYETFGDAGDPPILLVMGLATQMIGWAGELCAGLAARGYFVVRFDNRDIGLSTHLDSAGAPDILAVLGGDASSVPYGLADLADDTVGLLDALGLDSVHLIGASMGGMIAQLVALRHPARVRSLTSIMSTTGDPSVGGPSEAALALLLAPAARDRDAAVQRVIDTYRVIGSPGFEFDESALRERTGLSFDRAYDPAGGARQPAAALRPPLRPGRRRPAAGRRPHHARPHPGPQGDLRAHPGDPRVRRRPGGRQRWPRHRGRGPGGGAARRRRDGARPPPRDVAGDHRPHHRADRAGRLTVSWSASRPRPGASCRSRTRRRR